MADPITVTIGGEAITLPPILHFDELERVWPAMKALDATDDVVERTGARLAIISGVLKTTRPELTVPELKKRLAVGGFEEIVGLAQPVLDLLAASGLLKKEDAGPGEAQPAAIPPETASPTGNT
jgi:hypothetical protein